VSKTIQWVIGITSGLFLLLVLLLTSIEWTIFRPSYFMHQYEKRDIPKIIGIEPGNLEKITENILLYLKGERSDLSMQFPVNGISREIFNEKEKEHMVDVRWLFMKGYQLRIIGLIWIGAGFLFLWFYSKSSRRILFRGMQISIIIVLVLIILLFILLSIDFRRYFIVFHKIFFRNELWILNPKTDLLIEMVPEPFFFETAVRIGILFVIQTFVIMFLSEIASRILQKNR
jgi:integral membrane protein (TIGR01906 family)